jgi:serine/threonine protein kinase
LASYGETVSSEASIVAGRRVADRYRLVDERTVGCWDAVDEKLRRNVVVHLQSGAVDADTKAHFTAEARALAGLNHRNIVATYDTGVDGDGTAYRVDELAAGKPVDPGAVDDKYRVSFATQIARAIADAHGRGLVHGSLTSGQVLVDDEGRLKIRGLQLPPAAALDELKRVDLHAVINLVAALAPSTSDPLRDLALGWKGTETPSSVASMVNSLLTIPDDADTVPMVDPTPTPATGVPTPRRRQTAMVIGGLVGIALIALAITALLPSTGTPGDVSGPIGPLPLTATSYDPEVNPPTENEANAGKAVDGNASTQWSTDRYHGPHFAGLKSGVGLVLHHVGIAEFDELRIQSPTSDWTYEIYAAEQPAAKLSGWGTSIARGTVRDRDVRVDLGGARGQALLVWITDPGPGNQARLAELSVEGRA